ncbi:MAG TPA: SIMPL domain-containing protein [Nitrososphaera sp.]
MSTIKDSHDTLRRRVKSAGMFLAGMLALALLMATPLADSQIPTAQAQNTGQNITQAQEPAPRINATQTVTPADDRNLNNDSAAPSTVSTSGTATTTEVRPDQLSVTVAVETNGTTAQEAVFLNANLTAQVIAAVRGLGINENQIETSSYILSPIYQYIPPLQPCIEIYPPPPECETRQEIIGYRASNTVTATLDVYADLNAGQVIDAAVGAGANRVDGIVFFISQERQQQIRDSLIRDAIANARQRANIAAEALAMTVSGVQSATLNPIDFPVYSVGLREGAAAEAADSVSAPTPILPGQQEVSTTVSVVFYLSTEGSSDG